MKAFARGLGNDAMEPDEAAIEPPGPAEKKAGLPTAQATEALRKQAAQILRGRLIRASRPQISAICCEMARERFRKHRRFLL